MGTRAQRHAPLISRVNLNPVHRISTSVKASRGRPTPFADTWRSLDFSRCEPRMQRRHKALASGRQGGAHDADGGDPGAGDGAGDRAEAARGEVDAAQTRSARRAMPAPPPKAARAAARAPGGRSRARPAATATAAESTAAATTGRRRPASATRPRAATARPVARRPSGGGLATAWTDTASAAQAARAA